MAQGGANERRNALVAALGQAGAQLALQREREKWEAGYDGRLLITFHLASQWEGYEGSADVLVDIVDYNRVFAGERTTISQYDAGAVLHTISSENKGVNFEYAPSMYGAPPR